MLVDAHAHLVTDDPAYPRSAPAGQDNLMRAESLLDALRDNGLHGAVAVQRAHVYGYDNSYVLDSARNHPDRLRAMCVLDAQAPDADKTVHDLADRGAAALRLTAPGGNQHTGPAGAAWFAGAEARRVWAAAEETGLSMCLHVYRWNRDDVLRALPAVVRGFPGVPVVLDHVASVDVADRETGLLLALVDLPQVYVKVTTLNFAQLARADRDPGPLVEWLAAHFGAGRLLWGSDVTQTRGAYADMVTTARRAVAGLSEPDAARVLGGTAAQLYRLGG
ncbi:amidohydrolase family protein [Actinophytocola glycyrrhizae]|uniref:Amidohydrolase family protein n=1 Tax=Actinophytocola glycyrrhizae TaxID=2044873 RepID=A0ABV9S4S3_9PSEU